MSESFWFMTGEDDEPAVPVDHAPFQEPMRGDRKVTNAPSTDQKKVRRQIHRSGAERTATVLNTQVERLNKGDTVRTPTGQSSTVKGIRPHETDATKMYLDTDQGTSMVNKGTDFQVVPKNSQQQELPDIGNPMNSGNSAQVPGGGHGPGGPAGAQGPGASVHTQCPNCGNTNTMRLHGGLYVCSVCGFTIAAGGSPGGLLFSNQEHGVTPGRRKPGEVPTAHVWAMRYAVQTESQFASRMRQAAQGGDK